MQVPYTFGEARLRSCRKLPYLTKHVMSLIPVKHSGLGTFAIDQYMRVYFDPACLESWTLDQCAGRDSARGLARSPGTCRAGQVLHWRASESESARALELRERTWPSMTRCAAPTLLCRRERFTPTSSASTADSKQKSITTCSKSRNPKGTSHNRASRDLKAMPRVN